MGTMQEKIGQYVGIKYGEDIANELTNKTTVTIPPPMYSTAILLRHQEETRLDTVSVPESDFFSAKNKESPTSFQRKFGEIFVKLSC